MGCCESSNPEFIGLAQEFRNLSLDRRTTLKSLLGVAGILAISNGVPGRANAQGTKVRLAFCGQLLCVIPYEVTRARGHFADEGIDNV